MYPSAISHLLNVPNGRIGWPSGLAAAYNRSIHQIQGKSGQGSQATRSCYSVEAFQRFFERILELRIEAGLVDGEELYFNATPVEADAAMDSLRPRLSLVAAREHVQKIFEENASAQEAAETLAPADNADDSDAHNEAAQPVALKAHAGSPSQRLIVRSESETDYVKRGVRACTLDTILDLVLSSEMAIEPWRPACMLSGPERGLLHYVGDTFLQLGELRSGWENTSTDVLRGSRFLNAGEPSTL